MPPTLTVITHAIGQLASLAKVLMCALLGAMNGMMR